MLGKAKDATLELMDSVMTTRNASCLAKFSLSPLFRRKWSSTYEALEDNRLNRNKLMKRYIEEMPSSEYILLAIDHTAWERRGANVKAFTSQLVIKGTLATFIALTTFLSLPVHAITLVHNIKSLVFLTSSLQRDLGINTVSITTVNEPHSGLSSLIIAGLVLGFTGYKLKN